MCITDAITSQLAASSILQRYCKSHRSVSSSLAIRMKPGIKIAVAPLYKARFKAEGSGQPRAAAAVMQYMRCTKSW